jgi:hypothetical protein
VGSGASVAAAAAVTAAAAAPAAAAAAAGGPYAIFPFVVAAAESVLPGGQFREAYLRLCAEPSVRGEFVSLERDGAKVQPEDATAPFLEKCLCVLGEVEKAALHLAYRWDCDERTTIEGVVERVLEWVHRLDQLDVDTTYAVCTRLKAQKVLTVGSFQYDGPPMSSEYAVLNLLVSVPGVLERLGWET